MLDEKLECAQCYRVFTPKAGVGRRVQKPDHTKTYIGFGVAAVAIVVLFAVSGGSDPEPVEQTRAATPATPQFSRGNHPRAATLSSWSQAMASNNSLMLSRHSDLTRLAAQLGLPSSAEEAVVKGLMTHESTKLFRTMRSTAALDTDLDMERASGSAQIFVTPNAGDTTFKRNTNGIFSVTFTIDDDTLKVTSFKLIRQPIYAPGKDPSVKRYEVNKNIAKSKSVTINDSGGRRTVQESEPGAMPHWEEATPQQREMADQCVADIIASADDNSPGGLFMRATLKVRDMPDKQAAIPRVLNAMFERYDDPNAHNMELSQLNRAIANWTGYAVNYQVRSSGDAAKDKKERRSCIRQWFAFWRRYHKDLSEFFDESEELLDDEGGK